MAHLSTAYDPSTHQRNIALASGADCYLTEPLDPQTFLTVIEDMVRRYEMIQALYGVIGELRALIADLDQRLSPEGSPNGTSSALRSIAAQLTLLEQHERQQLTQGLFDYLTQLVVTVRIKLQRGRRTRLSFVMSYGAECPGYAIQRIYAVVTFRYGGISEGRCLTKLTGVG